MHLSLLAATLAVVASSEAFRIPFISRFWIKRQAFAEPSQDGFCGYTAYGPVTCEGSPFGICCSMHGTCTSTLEGCNVGCQQQWGVCDSSAGTSPSNETASGAGDPLDTDGNGSSGNRMSLSPPPLARPTPGGTIVSTEIPFFTNGSIAFLSTTVIVAGSSILRGGPGPVVPTSSVYLGGLGPVVPTSGPLTGLSIPVMPTGDRSSGVAPFLLNSSMPTASIKPTPEKSSPVSVDIFTTATVGNRSGPPPPGYTYHCERKTMTERM